MADLHPQLRELRDFYYKTALKLPPDTSYVHAKGLIDKPSFFTLEHLQRHLNNPLLMPGWFALFWNGKPVDCKPAIGNKVIQKASVPFLNKGIIQEYLEHGASLVLEGLDILEPNLNAMCAAIDAPHASVLSNSVAFFSHPGNEAYRGHIDTDDVLVIQLSGQKAWQVHERQPQRRTDLNELTPEQMGRLQTELVMNPGDALFLKSCTPHQVRTTGKHSLHIAFDICDRNINAETALQVLLQEYDLDASRSYSPTRVVIDKLIEHARSPRYWQRIDEMQATWIENHKRARNLLGSNKVSYLDTLLAAEKRSGRS